MEEREEGMGVQDDRGLSSIWGLRRWGVWGGGLLLLLLHSGPFEPCLELFGGIGRALLDSFAPLWPFVDKAEVKRRYVTAPFFLSVGQPECAIKALLCERSPFDC